MGLCITWSGLVPATTPLLIVANCQVQVATFSHHSENTVTEETEKETIYFGSWFQGILVHQ